MKFKNLQILETAQCCTKVHWSNCH